MATRYRFGSVSFASAVYAATIGLSAFLLFLVQPMIAKMILQLFGGGAAVWLACVIFFQLLLFAGYASSHWLVTRYGPRRHLVYQAGLTALSLLFVPFAVTHGIGIKPPAGIFLILLAAVGFPYFVLSTTGPVIQRWFAAEGRGNGVNPYILYAVSNAGSLAGLFAYPLVIEINLSTGMQASLWAALYALYAALIAACIRYFHLADGTFAAPSAPAGIGVPAITPAVRRGWVLQSTIPSAMLIVVTHYLTQDVVNFPLLWVLPLGLYLLSFVICFAFPAVSRLGRLRALLVLAPVLLLLLFQEGRGAGPFYVKIAVALAALFGVAMFFHGNLEREKPHTFHLTSFYLHVSLGGLLGSIATGIISPLLFKTQFEFSLVILAAIFLIVISDFPLRRPATAAFHVVLVSAATVGWAHQEMGWHLEVTEAARSFYGTYRVEDRRGSGGIAYRQLVAGTHMHGIQRIGGGEPLAYYHEQSGIGLALRGLPRVRRVAVVGMGAGVMAAYGKAGDRYDFYELDPVVADLARRQFTYMAESRAEVAVITGDGRFKLHNAPDGSYDLIVVDAFTSGSIPAHLITAEFAREALAKLAPDGLLMYNISNRYIDLLPVLRGNATLLGLHIARHIAPAVEEEQKYAAVWVVLARGRARFDALTAGNREWCAPGGAAVFWSDAKSDVWTLLNFTAN